VYDVLVILVVEDDVDVREMLEFTFKSNGFAVTVATDGAAALAAIEKERPCLVILDLIMPRMSGWQLLTELKARNLDDVPVCVISALETKIPDGAVASFMKPFDVKELVAVAARYCAHSRAAA
jgi:two-component system phosphate regulon response regulator OmpR